MLLRRGSKDRAVGDVVGRAGVGLLQLLEVVGGDAENAVRTNHGAGTVCRQVVLPNMHTLVTGGDADVGAIVHDEGDVIAEDSAQFAGMAEHLAGVAYFVAILQQGHASGHEVTGIVRNGRGGAQRRREKSDVEDGVQLG